MSFTAMGDLGLEAVSNLCELMRTYANQSQTCMKLLTNG